MKPPIQAITSALCLLFASSPTVADVIYLRNGNVLVVQKAWEEGAEVRYQTGGEVQTLPKSAVKRIQEQKALPAPEGGAPRYGIAIGDGNPAAVANSTPSETTRLRSSTSAVSKELLNRLRENLKSAPADAQAKSELAQALNSLAALQATQGDLSGAKSSL